jgi:predicted DNA-binding transcriptional regulator AlpA
MAKRASQTTAKHSSSPTPVLTEKYAAPYTGMSTAWLRQARIRGIGPAYIRVGRSIRYRVADLDAWVAAHRVDTRDSRQHAGA